MTSTNRILSDDEIEAIREAVFSTVPPQFMDTQKIILENKQLKSEVTRLQSWIALLVDKVKDDTGVFRAPFTAADAAIDGGAQE